MAKLKTYDDVERAVAANGGVKTFEMWELRDVHGADRLGKHVVSAISANLADAGLMHYPEDLPLSQLEKVRLFKRSSPVGRLMAAMNTLDRDSDNTLRELAGSEAQSTLQKIRELVCE